MQGHSVSYFSQNKPRCHYNHIDPTRVSVLIIYHRIDDYGNNLNYVSWDRIRNRTIACTLQENIPLQSCLRLLRPLDVDSWLTYMAGFLPAGIRAIVLIHVVGSFLRPITC